MRSRWLPLVILCILAVPLLFWLRWTAEAFPNADDLSIVTQVDDRFVLIERLSSGGAQWGGYGTRRYRLLDRQTGWSRSFRPTDRTITAAGSPQVLSDGRIAWAAKDREWRIHFINPAQNKSESATVLLADEPKLFGDRFVLFTDNNSRLYWLDVHKANSIIPTASDTTIYRDVHRVAGSTEPIFYDSYSPGNKNTVGGLRGWSVGVELGVPEPDPPKPKWADMLDREKLSPAPHPRFQLFSMAILYRMTEHGPEEIGHWPLPRYYSWGTGIKDEGPYLFTTSLDARFVEVHAAESAALISRIPIPPPTSAGLGVSWKADRDTIRFQSGKSTTVVDTLHGRALPFDATDSEAHVLSLQANRYLTVASHDPNIKIGLPGSWPLTLQVRSYPQGDILARHQLPLGVNLSNTKPSNIRLTPNAEQIVIETTEERILILDAISGKVLNIIQATHWMNVACVLGVIGLIVWIVSWIILADRAGLPRLLTMLVVTGLVMSFLLWRLHLSGSAGVVERVASIVIIALCIAWGAELMQHLCRPGATLSSCTVAVTAYIGGLAWFICLHRPQPDQLGLLTTFTMIQIYFALFYLGLRRAKVLKSIGPSESVRSQFSLGAILVLTTFVAVVASYLVRQNHLRVFASYREFFSTATVLALLTALALASRYSLWFRLIAIPACLVAAYYAHQYHYRTGDLLWLHVSTKYVTAVCIVCSFQAIPLSGRFHRDQAVEA